MTPQVVQLPREEWRTAGEVEGRAFADTPLFLALFPDDQTRAESSLVLMSAGVRMALLAGKIVETVPSRMAVMVWDPPGHTDSPWLPLRMPRVMVDLMRRVPRADLQRMMDWQARWAKRRHKLLPEPHWYAEMLAVDPDRQRFGLGAVLTRHGLARADTTGIPVFLEADSATNAAFYAKLGFKLVEHGHDDVIDLPVWRMVHRPETGTHAPA
jgi:GNAT superfamily N-acetyltransferase